MKFERRNFFQGHAIAAGVSLTDGEGQRLESCLQNTSAALPVTGGCLTAQSAQQEIVAGERTVLSFDSAQAVVRGQHGAQRTGSGAAEQNADEQQDGSAVQVVCECSVRNLDIQGRFQASFVESNLISSDPGNGEPMRFGTLRPQEFQGLMVDGKPLRVHIERANVFLDTPTKHELVERFEHDEDFRKQCGACLSERESESLLDRVFHKIPQVNDYIVTSIVRGLVFDDGVPPGVAIEQPNKLRIENFGTVFFGELLIGDATRRLTAIRFQFEFSAPMPEPAAQARLALEGRSTPPPPPPPPPVIKGTGVICETKPNGETT